MRRGTPSAELFGGLLTMIRLAGTGCSMRRIGERIGAPAATVSQTEKGQRALKEPKLSAWASALEVDESDLHDLWLLCQGLIEHRDRLVFYGDDPAALGVEPLDAEIVQVLEQRPDLESVYRLTGRMVDVLRRLLPAAKLSIVPSDFEPPYVLELNVGTITDDQRYENEEVVDAWHLPCIHCPRADPPGYERRAEYEEGELVQVPVLGKPAPIVRRRGKSVKATDLEDLVRTLSGPERERVRGYVDAIIEQRPDLGR
jgi:transcriptional regulator with XRE-family HTH domain